MKLRTNMNSKNKTLQTVGLIALTAGILYYPAMRLYNYMLAKKQNRKPEDEEATPVKKVFGAYRNTHKPHHRKAESNALSNGHAS